MKKCRNNIFFSVMYQGRSTSPVYRFLTKNGEWIWMQMSATLTYIPNTKIPYAANYIFKVIKYVCVALCTFMLPDSNSFSHTLTRNYRIYLYIVNNFSDIFFLLYCRIKTRL